MPETAPNSTASGDAEHHGAGRADGVFESSSRARRPEFFYLTAPEPCPYLPGRLERKVVARLGVSDAKALHDALARAGFRRTRRLVYRPACPGCDACIPIRVAVDDFTASRSLKRVEKINADLSWSELPPIALPEHYRLFADYMEARHGDGGMAEMDFADYRKMVEDSPVDTLIAECRDREDRLVAVALTDRLADGLSGIYIFFDPGQARRSPGIYAVLWLIRRARELALPYVYLGYWIPACAKMSYKDRFRPFETLTRKGWRRHEGPANKGAPGSEGVRPGNIISPIYSPGGAPGR